MILSFYRSSSSCLSLLSESDLLDEPSTSGCRCVYVNVFTFMFLLFYFISNHFIETKNIDLFRQEKARMKQKTQKTKPN